MSDIYSWVSFGYHLSIILGATLSAILGAILSAITSFLFTSP